MPHLEATGSSVDTQSRLWDVPIPEELCAVVGGGTGACVVGGD